ncbi:uncharacterized protein F5891DRAFT_1188365 [Suillus fuscotomentosus]|uniref:Uncharacterized protein n=1 Tax=Suillus fuscotomentosus TaxID=1912939 RepID=A0AAD4HLH8_9AGAM|nr:uncharacterized protein F5891DRAFT_1188365 [Suillus fuscotomentosus]KAG1900867.1 hypothetical protein F5891DRAFT_1188365 [Suillus fuscotomentosus]
MKAARKESPWNQHQTWFAVTCPPPKGVSGAVSSADLKAWKVKQQAHYKAHPHSDPQHLSVWKEILENWDRLMMAVHDAFTKSAAYWHRTHGIHIASVAIFPGDKEAGRQASGLFAGSDMVKALINSHQLDIKCWLDELTTILKYKDLEAAHSEGKTFSLLPPSSTTPNSTLLCNGKPARDRNRKVAPMMISEKFAEAGHPLKTSNSRWLTMLDILYAKKLAYMIGPPVFPLPGLDFDLKALSASQLCALVAPYLRIHLGAMYEAELGLDDNDNDSEAEAAKAKKRKGKSKKSGDKGRKKGPIAKEPSVVLHISRWPESDILALKMQASNACLILLVINTDGRVVHTLQDSEKRCTNEVIQKPAISNSAASRSTIGALRPNQEALYFNNAAPSSNREASRSHQYTNRVIHEDLLPSLPPQEAPHLHRPTNRVFDDLPPSSPSTPSSQFLSPPPISRSSTPVPTSDYLHVWSRSRYKPSHNGALRHQHAYNDVMPTYNSDIRKQTQPHYESALETEDLEREMVEERHRVRVHDNSHIHSGRAQSQIGMQKPEEKSVGSMDVVTNFLFDVDGDVIMEIHQPYDELEAHMDVDADFVTLESMDIAHAAGELEWHMDVDADIVMHESMVILQVADELEWCMDVDADIVMHDSMVIA